MFLKVSSLWRFLKLFGVVYGRWEKTPASLENEGLLPLLHQVISARRLANQSTQESVPITITSWQKKVEGYSLVFCLSDRRFWKVCAITY